jgi:hypothetical protein
MRIRIQGAKSIADLDPDLGQIFRSQEVEFLHIEVMGQNVYRYLRRYRFKSLFERQENRFIFVNLGRFPQHCYKSSIRIWMISW